MDKPLISRLHVPGFVSTGPPRVPTAPFSLSPEKNHRMNPVSPSHHPTATVCDIRANRIRFSETDEGEIYQPQVHTPSLRHWKELH